MKIKDPTERLQAAMRLMTGDQISVNNIYELQKILKGINPKLDSVIDSAVKALGKVKKLQNTDVIRLSADKLPEDTDKHKKRKAAIIFFLKQYKKLKSETERVAKELGADSSQPSPNSDQSSALKRIFTKARGPFGLVTIAATGIVATGIYLKTAAVEISINNQGCPEINPALSRNISIPGLKLPDQPIATGQTASATLPPLSGTVDATTPGRLSISSLKFNYSFNLPANLDIIWNGQSLLGKQTQIILKDAPTHQLTLNCQTS